MESGCPLEVKYILFTPFSLSVHYLLSGYSTCSLIPHKKKKKKKLEQGSNLPTGFGGKMEWIKWIKWINIAQGGQNEQFGVYYD